MAKRELCLGCHMPIKDEGGGVHSVNGYCPECVVRGFINFENENELLRIRIAKKDFEIKELKEDAQKFQKALASESDLGMLYLNTLGKLEVAAKIIEAAKDAGCLNYELRLAKEQGIGEKDIELLRLRRANAVFTSQYLARNFYKKHHPSSANLVSDVLRYDPKQR